MPRKMYRFRPLHHAKGGSISAIISLHVAIVTPRAHARARGYVNVIGRGVWASDKTRNGTKRNEMEKIVKSVDSGVVR